VNFSRASVSDLWETFRISIGSRILPPTTTTTASPKTHEPLIPPESAADPATEARILDEYVHVAPSGKVALDIFRDEWSSRLPSPYEGNSGQADLFNDDRITWAVDLLGGIEGFNVLELGPLEAGHTTMLESASAASIVAVEGNTRAFLKCLIVKELLRLNRSQFLCGDLMEYLDGDPGRFDLCVASGVLYHLQEPMKALHLISAASDQLLLWTHYYDKEILEGNAHLSPTFSSTLTERIGDFEYVHHRYEYGKALAWKGFCGGNADHANWLSRNDILSGLQQFGYSSIEVGFDHPYHPNGPAFAVLARK
jgi:hypothetical protein